MGRISASALQQALAEGRRAARRYDIALTLRFAALRRSEPPITGGGESLNISRTGMLFRTDGRLVTGDALVVVLDWPVTTRDNEPLKLVITGQVVRTKRGLAGMVVHTHRLLREHELDSRITTFWARPEPTSRRRTAPQGPVVLIEEADSVALLVSIVVTPQNWTIERAGVETAKAILRSGKPPIQLLITRTPELLQGLDPAIPAILILDANAPDDAEGQVTAHPLHVAVRKPLTDIGLRALIGLLCKPVEQSMDATSGALGPWTH